MFYSWDSLEEFDAWHQTVKNLLGIPYPGTNSATGEVDLEAQWTTEYTTPVVVSENDVRAYVEDQIAELVTEGIGVPSEPPPSDE